MRNLIVLIFLLPAMAGAQVCGTLNIQHVSDIASVCSTMVMTMIQDQAGRDYLYVANKESGLTVYDISNAASPVFAASVPVSQYDSLHVMNLCQQGNYLFLALGNHFASGQASGLAIVDVGNPLQPVLSDYWTLPSSDGGAGIVAVEGDYAYLGAMGNGLVILDVTDKSNIIFKSRLVPDINYPVVNPSNPATFNARGMAVRNSLVYLCYDAGGLRIINTTDKLNPRECGRYSNPALNANARAYNNITLNDSLAYIAVDYCGLEVLNIADTANLILRGRWNPYNCPSNNWFNTPVHANEIAYKPECGVVFLSTGKSDMYVVNVSDPGQPDSCDIYGGVSNNIGTWGISVFQHRIFLSYVCSVIPFSSNWTGVKILSWDDGACAVSREEKDENAIRLWPQPSGGRFNLELPEGFSPGQSRFYLMDVCGRESEIHPSEISGMECSFEAPSLANGIYFLRMECSGENAARIVWMRR